MAEMVGLCINANGFLKNMDFIYRTVRKDIQYGRIHRQIAEQIIIDKNRQKYLVIFACIFYNVYGD